jgi:DNA invertase Pin-like site-specific DNA recombinase
MHHDLPREGDGRAGRPARTVEAPESHRPRRRRDGDAHRRLARSTFDLFAIVKQIVDAKAQFRSLAETWADTGTSTRRLMIAVLGGLADVERDLIRTRTAEGRERAKARGQHMGRPPKLTPQQQKEARRRRAEGATLKETAKSYNVGRATISRLAAAE